MELGLVGLTIELPRQGRYIANSNGPITLIPDEWNWVHGTLTVPESINYNNKRATLDRDFRSDTSNMLYKYNMPNKSVLLKISTSRTNNMLVSHMNTSMHICHMIGSIDMVLHGNKFYISIIEFIDGPNLLEVINDDSVGPNIDSIEGLLCMIFDIVNGVQFLHSYGIVHRDIKPENIMFDNMSRHFRLIDFDHSCSIYLENGGIVTSNGTTQGYRRMEMEFNTPMFEDDYFALGITLFTYIVKRRITGGIKDEGSLRLAIQILTMCLRNQFNILTANQFNIFETLVRVISTMLRLGIKCKNTLKLNFSHDVLDPLIIQVNNL